MEPKMKLVEFENYCKTCIHKYAPGIDEPCNTCLTNPVNENSHKPVNYIKGDDKL